MIFALLLLWCVWCAPFWQTTTSHKNIKLLNINKFKTNPLNASQNCLGAMKIRFIHLLVDGWCIMEIAPKLKFCNTSSNTNNMKIIRNIIMEYMENTH